MNLEPTETQRLLEETVRGFLEAEAPYDRTRKLEADQGWDRDCPDPESDQGRDPDHGKLTKADHGRPENT